MFLDGEVTGQINALTWQAEQQWKKLNLPPLEHPDMDVEFYFADARGDRDNRFTTVLDCLRKAGVIVNDNAKRFNGTLVILPAVVGGGREGVVIDIATAQQSLLVRKA